MPTSPLRQTITMVTTRATTPGDDTAVARPAAVETIDPVCGMTVMADRANRPVEHDGRTYYFCGVGCRDAFVGDPERYVSGVETG